MILRVARPWLLYSSLRVASQRTPWPLLRRSIQAQTTDGNNRSYNDALSSQELEIDNDSPDVDIALEEMEDDGEGSDKTQRAERPKPAHWVKPEIMRAAKKEVVWLMADKASLAKRIQIALDEGQVALATAITRLASRGKDEAVVAWNLLIKHEMQQKPMLHHDKALKLYNEMKKRNQSPDAYTYGTLLAGLNEHPRPKYVVERAFNLYKLMQKEGSKVQPNILHLNMLISITGRALDMERFWSVVRDIPETGPDAATAQTYVSLLEALRKAHDCVQEDGTALPPAAYDEAFQAALAIWGAAVDGWSKGALELDEEVVSAMARFLNASPKVEHANLVFPLIEQTTGLPRFTAHNRHQGYKNKDYAAAFDAVRDKPHAVLVKPSNRLLMQALIASQRLNLKSTADYYWNSMTGPSGYGILPDLAALKQYLRVLRISRSNRDATRVVTTWHNPSQLTEAVFAIAMSTCRRNAWRQGALADATQLYSFSKTVNKHQSMKILEAFIETLDVSLLDSSIGNDQRIAALDAIGFNLEKLLSIHSLGWSQADRATSSLRELEGRSITSAKIVIGTIDYLSHQEHGLQDDLKRFAPMKAKLTEFVRQRHQSNAPSAKPRRSTVTERVRLVGKNINRNKPIFIVQGERYHGTNGS